MKKPELLSPAGDFESLKSAIYAGANAVYFGAKNFNARAKANNFGDDLSRAVAFVHLYGAKAYLTLNTLIEDEDAINVIETVKNALSVGIDAFIVQDFGIVNLIKNSFDNVEIHASTQMAVNNYLGALTAEKMGIKRVVLSRETSLEDIKLIKQKTNLEIEYFVQGALCVCLSGNCYLSSCLFSKSGNKGECLQPCRLPYKALLKGKTLAEGYLLSAKDINLSSYLKTLAEIGVDSFKIEGRLRRPAYVYSVTNTYRNIIDNNYQSTDQDQINIKKAFNRGNFTPAYFNGNGNIIDKNIQGHIGIKIGKVLNFEKGKKFNIITLSSTHKLTKGDTLKLINQNKELCVITAMDIKSINKTYQITTTTNVTKGADVHLILDAQKEKIDLTKIKRLPINFNLIAYADKNIVLEYELLGKTKGDIRLKGSVSGSKLERAKTIALDFQNAKQSLQKLNDTQFMLNSFNLQTDNVFVSKQELNNLRNQAVENILQHFEKNIEIKANYEYVNSQLNKINNSKNNIIKNNFNLVKPRDYVNFNYEKYNNKNSYLYIPPFLRNADIEVIKNILSKYQNMGIYAQNLSALQFERKTILGTNLNIKNIFAINELYNENIDYIFASPELSSEDFENLSNLSPVKLINSTFEDIDVMTLVHCPIKMLFNSTCKDCKYQDGIQYIMQNNQKLYLYRYKLANCYFGLKTIPIQK